MPIEIKELHIKVVLDETANSPVQSSADDLDVKDKIIEACVEQVMEILSKKEER